MLFPFLCALVFFYTNVVVSTESNFRRNFECDNTSNYTSNSTFSTNLAQALNTLQRNTATTGFNTTTAGNMVEQVTALALCRGSSSPSTCQSCIGDASLGIRNACPNQTTAQIWYDLCMVRYSSTNFISEPNNDIVYFFDGAPVALDPDSYSQRVEYLMRNLSSTAVSADKRYAVGRIELLNLTVYGYVDCTRDISSEECRKCLLSALEAIQTCCLTKNVVWILTPTCNFQFNTDTAAHLDWINAPLVKYDTEEAAVAPTVGRGRRNGLAIEFLGGAVVIAILVTGMLWVIVKRARRRGKVETNISGNGDEIAEEMMKREFVGTRPPFLYDLDQLVAATDNFSPCNRLGKGGFGTVYKGRMANGEEIAVKKLSIGSKQGITEFFNEVKALLNVQHKNLVKLLGCCVQGEERMLVYEYLANKSLDYILFDKVKSTLLDWPTRYNIIVGVARGLHYLHEDSLLKIIHRDIKASNILLDGQMNPKIADFGLAKLFNDEESHVRTYQIAGTFGYMAPEYANQGYLSDKSDVFSFGVLLLETISGRRNFDIKFDEKQRELPNLTWRLRQEGRLMELVDVTMGPFPEDELLRCIQIGLLCCQESTRDRPTMSSTLAMLSNKSLAIPLTGICLRINDDVLTQQENNCFSLHSITTSLAANGR